jgi:hypothetical protein
VSNARLILPRIWERLRKPERWQAGQTYAEIYAEGRKDALNGLKAAMSEVSGFDYVPENLRSATFTRAARDVLEAHQGYNNFYTEPGPMRALSALGTTIPSPAFPVCMTAILSVWLGNAYGHCWAAEDSAKKVLRGLSKDRWGYYLSEVLPRDSDILVKLTFSRPAERWADMIKTFDVGHGSIGHTQVQRLVRVGAERKFEEVRTTAQKLIALSRSK